MIVIIKITISPIVIALKTSYFSLIHLPSCYLTVFYWTIQYANHIRSCSLNQPVTTSVLISIKTVYGLPNLGSLSSFLCVGATLRTVRTNSKVFLPRFMIMLEIQILTNVIEIVKENWG